MPIVFVLVKLYGFRFLLLRRFAEKKKLSPMPRYTARCGGGQKPSTPMLDSQEKSQIKPAGTSVAPRVAPQSSQERTEAREGLRASARRGDEAAIPPQRPAL